MGRAAIGVAMVLCASASVAEVHIGTTSGGRFLFTNTPSKGSATPTTAVQRLVRDDVEPLVDTYADLHRIDPKLVHAVIRAESGYNARAVSSKGAMGLMQLMPGTARELEVADAFDPAANIAGGTRYLRMMLDEFEGSLDLALAGYNAGPRAVRRFGGVPPYPETRRYVERILRDYRGDDSFQLPRGRGPAIGRKVHVSRDPSGRLVLSTFGDD